jgi:nucleoside 2-deoxyribosyltransferase
VVGGVYQEYCVHPHWNELYGSAGRAAVALAAMGQSVHLHSYFTEKSANWFRGAFELYGALKVHETRVGQSLAFRYFHDSSDPEIAPKQVPHESPIKLQADKVVRFGMLEGNAVVEANSVVYDPQNPGAPVPFAANGSKAKRLGLVLNAFEAQTLANAFGKSPEDCARLLSSRDGAELVVIKQGPLGAFVWDKGKIDTVPAYRTSSVWKIGSGDCFVAHFAQAWMGEGLGAVESALRASRATAYYCQYRALPSPEQLASFEANPLQISNAFKNGAKRKVYLAGAFFDLSQIWIIDEARRNLRELGLIVFSPFHDVGVGTARDVVSQDIEALEQADVVFAIADGVDAGTIFEVGFARAKGIPVVVYSEREGDESLKMAEGTSCVICRNYTTAIYSTLWEAARV